MLQEASSDTIYQSQDFETAMGDLLEPSGTDAESKDLLVVSSTLEFISPKLLFFDVKLEFMTSLSLSFPFPFRSFLLPSSLLSACGSSLGLGNKGGSWPLNRQNTFSTVSLISLPRPSLSKIKSQTDLEAFSSIGALHEMSMD